MIHLKTLAASTSTPMICIGLSFIIDFNFYVSGMMNPSIFLFFLIVKISLLLTGLLGLYQKNKINAFSKNLIGKIQAEAEAELKFAGVEYRISGTQEAEDSPIIMISFPHDFMSLAKLKRLNLVITRGRVNMVYLG